MPLRGSNFMCEFLGAVSRWFLQRARARERRLSTIECEKKGRANRKEEKRGCDRGRAKGMSSLSDDAVAGSSLCKSEPHKTAQPATTERHENRATKLTSDQEEGGGLSPFASDRRQ